MAPYLGFPSRYYIIILKVASDLPWKPKRSDTLFYNGSIHANSALRKVYAQGVLAKIEYIKICFFFFFFFGLIEKRRGLSPGGRFPPSFIHQVIIITGLNKLQLYVLALKMALDADRA